MKRGASGLSLVVGVDKPEGLSSHDVVNRCRRIFGERRVGHTGTLDPLATGAMSQNAALAAQALGLDARFTTSFNRSAIEETLNLGPVMNVMGVLAVGRQ